MKLKILMMSVGLLIINVCIVAQQDSVLVEESVEDAIGSDFNKRKKYRYIDHRHVEEKTLIKICTSPMFVFSSDPFESWGNGKARFNATLGLEQKIKPALSLALNIYHDEIETEFTLWKSYIAMGARYYYGMDKRIRAGKGANNFHGNYFSFFVNDLVKHQATVYYVDNGSYRLQELSKDEWLFEPTIKLAWGMQRRFGKMGLIDAGLYLLLGEEKLGAGLDLQIGLAW